MQKLLSISTWPQHIQIYLSYLKKIEKMSKVGVWIPHTFRDKNKKDCISIATSFLSRQENHPFGKNLITSDGKWVLYVQGKSHWQGKISAAYPKGVASWKKIYSVCMVGSPWYYSFCVLNHNQILLADLYSLNCCNMCMKIFWEKASHTSIEETLYLSMITQGHIQQESHSKKNWI